MCIDQSDPNYENLSLQGSFSANAFSYLKIQFKTCDPANKNNVTCANKTTSDDFLQN